MNDSPALIAYRNIAQGLYLVATLFCAFAGMHLVFRQKERVRGLLRPWHGVVALTVLGLQLLATILAVMFLRHTRVDAALLSIVNHGWIIAILSLMTFPLGILLESRAGRARRAGEARTVLAGTLLIIALSFGMALYLEPLIGLRESPALKVVIESGWAFAAFAPMALAAPFAEEIVFRLSLQNIFQFLAVRRGLPGWMAIFPTSLLFALGHAGMALPDGFKEAQIFLVGLVLGWLQWRHGYRACVLAHMGLNATTVVLQALMLANPGWSSHGGS